MPHIKLYLSLIAFGITLMSFPIILACGSTQIQFAVKHLRDETGEQITEVVSYRNQEALDNTTGEGVLQVQIEFKRNYRHQIIERMTSNQISGQSVRDKIVELYKLPPNDPEGAVQTALCPVSVMIPPGMKAEITVEWTERWAEGVINEGTDGNGDRLGTFEVFLGYIEPCSLINQENIE